MRKYKGKKICIICEGYEELDYIETLVSKAVFSDKYDFITVNAKSINTIIARYQEKYQSDSYSLVLIFCDTDKGPSEKYKEIKQKINDFHGEDVADDIVIFGNPCTMQIILSHFAEIKLMSQSKAINSKYIKEYIGIDNYKATNEQRKELFSKIKRSNYEKMKENVAKLSTDDNVISSTNILKFIKNFECDNESWIEEINKKLFGGIEMDLEFWANIATIISLPISIIALIIGGQAIYKVNKMKSVFKNLVCYLKPINEREIKLTIKALKLIEPNSSFAISFSNKIEDIQFHVDSDGMSNIYSGKIENCNFRGARVSRVLTPQFPFEATIKNNSSEKLKDVAVWHQIGKKQF